MKCEKCGGTGHLFYGYDDCSHCDECEGTGNSFAGYSIVVSGRLENLSWKKEMMLIDLILLVNDYENLRKYIK